MLEMTASGTSSKQITAEDFTKSWQYKVGLFLIVVGNLGILVGMSLGLFGVSAATIGAIMIGGEIISLASIVFLGKEGFKAIKNKVFGFVKSTYTKPISKPRHYLGISLLLTNILTTYLMMIYAWDALDTAAVEGSAAPVWGLNIAQQGDLVFYLFLIGELSFLIAIYVLGADWWGKFRRIFVWESQES